MANFQPFLPNLPTFGQLKQNGVLGRERGHDGPSFGAIRKKVIRQFLRKFALSPKSMEPLKCHDGEKKYDRAHGKITVSTESLFVRTVVLTVRTDKQKTVCTVNISVRTVNISVRTKKYPCAQYNTVRTVKYCFPFPQLLYRGHSCLSVRTVVCPWARGFSVRTVVCPCSRSFFCIRGHSV